MYKETGTLDRLLVISPSFNSNIKLMAKLDVKAEDVFDNPDEPGLITKIVTSSFFYVSTPLPPQTS